jgi:hypothetical protein
MRSSGTAAQESAENTPEVSNTSSNLASGYARADGQRLCWGADRGKQGWTKRSRIRTRGEEDWAPESQEELELTCSLTLLSPDAYTDMARARMSRRWSFVMVRVQGCELGGVGGWGGGRNG